MFQSRIRFPRRLPEPALLAGARERAQAPEGVAPPPGERSLAGHDAARRFFANCFHGADPRRETLFVAYVDRAARCIHQSRPDGDEGGIHWPLRTILLEAARNNCAGLLIAHNHPSGECTPSPSDLAATRRLASTADAIDVTLVDHLIFAGPDCASFRRLGYL